MEMLQLLATFVLLGGAWSLEKGCRWSSGLENRLLDGYDEEFISGVTIEECKTFCEAEATFKCRSFDYYNSAEGSCWLSWADRYWTSTVESEWSTYYEIICSNDPKSRQSCPFVGPVVGLSLPNNNLVKMENVSVEDCEMGCRREQSFHCSSFDYNREQQFCFLQVVDREDATLEPMADFDYFELNCEPEGCPGGSWLGPEKDMGLDANNRKVIENSTEEDCRTSCENERTFRCKSFEFKTGVCYLQSVTKMQVPLTREPLNVYYERIGCPKTGGSTPRPLQCYCVGDPHCVSFDGVSADFMGTCKYILARDNCVDGFPDGNPTWGVIINNDRNYFEDDFATVHEVRVILNEQDLIIDLFQGLFVQVAGSPVLGFPRYPHEDVTITKTGNTVFVAVKGGIQVQWDGNNYVKVEVPQDFAEETCGLCGNADGDINNDWVIGDSAMCMESFTNAKPGETTNNVNEFGFSWTHNKDDSEHACQDNCLSPPQPAECPDASEDRAKEHCSLLTDDTGPFKDCLSQMSDTQMETISDNCVYDSCHLNNYETVICEHAASMAKVCQTMYAAEVSWRSPELCPVVCGAGMEYQTCGSICMPTCSEPEGKECGDAGGCDEGCFCKPGFLYDGNSQCIKRASCGCKVPQQGDVYVNVGESFLDGDCTIMSSCNEAGGKLIEEDYICTSNKVCGYEDGVHGCFCKPPFVLDSMQCIKYTNPCTTIDRGVFQCLTCNALTDAECRANGTMVDCPQTDAICSRDVDMSKSGEVLSVNRGCRSRPACTYESLGPDAKDCIEDAHGIRCSKCSYGSRDEDFMCKLEDPASVCVLLMDEGVGGRSLTRYYYNSDKEKCLEFLFRGEGGNGNHFLSMEKCSVTCRDAVVPEECHQVPDPGSCDDHQRRYYFDAKRNQCKSFQFGGCGGNDNKFASKKECAETCMGE